MRRDRKRVSPFSFERVLPLLFWFDLGCAECGINTRGSGGETMFFIVSPSAFPSLSPKHRRFSPAASLALPRRRLTPTAPQKTLSQTLSLHPSYFTPALRDYLIELLHSTVEGSCSGRLGYIIAVLDFKPPTRGKIVEGGAEFTVSYEAIVYRPFRGEVVDGVVGSVNKVTPALLSATRAVADSLPSIFDNRRWESLSTLDPSPASSPPTYTRHSFPWSVSLILSPR